MKGQGKGLKAKAKNKILIFNAAARLMLVFGIGHSGRGARQCNTQS